MAREMKDITYEPAREGEALYRADCDACGEWGTFEGLRRAKTWSRKHVYEGKDEFECSVTILKRLGWVA